MPLELAELLQPIADDEPGGPYLRYDPVYDQIRIARTEEEELPSGEWERERKTADPAQVIRLSHELLGTRSKDLQIAAWLAEALLKRDGFGGLADGLDLIRGLLEEFWEHLHPELEDDGDAEMRAAPLVWLGGYLDRAVRMMPVVAGRFDMAAYRDSRQVGYEEDAVTYEARDIRKAAIEAGRIVAHRGIATCRHSVEDPGNQRRGCSRGCDQFRVLSVRAAGFGCLKSPVKRDSQRSRIPHLRMQFRWFLPENPGSSRAVPDRNCCL